MLILLIVGAALLAIAAAIAFYYNYIANYHMVQIFGDRGRRIQIEKGVIPVFDLPDLLIDKDEFRLLRLVKLRKLPVAVCLGDSITHGIVSVNYVAALQEAFQGRCVFVNSGVNGNLAYNLRMRMREDCLEYDPDFVTVLIGTNDVNCRSGGKALKSYQRFQGLSVIPDKAFFLENLRGVFDSLKQGTRARVAAISLPVLGEDLESEPNRLTREYSADIEAMAGEYGFAYLPLNEAQNAYLSSQATRRPVKYRSRWLLLNILLMLRRSFDRIAEIHGRRLTYDGLHETQAGADMIVELISGWLKAEFEGKGGEATLPAESGSKGYPG